MEHILYNIGNLVVLVTLAILVMHYKTMDRTYLPFFLLILIASINELASPIIASIYRNSSVNNNIYVLLEGLLILWQFKKWELFANSNKIYRLLLAVLITVWLWEMFIHSRIIYVGSYYRIVYATIISFTSIHMINRLVVTENKSLLKSSAFLICMAFIFYFPIKILVEIFYLYGYQTYPEMAAKVYHIHFFVNLFSNLIFAVAALWIPRNRVFFIPS